MFDSVNQKSLEDFWPNIVRKLRTGFNPDIPTNTAPIADTDLMNFLGLMKNFIPMRSSIKVASATLFAFSKVIYTYLLRCAIFHLYVLFLTFLKWARLISNFTIEILVRFSLWKLEILYKK